MHPTTFLCLIPRRATHPGFRPTPGSSRTSCPCCATEFSGSSLAERPAPRRAASATGARSPPAAPASVMHSAPPRLSCPLLFLTSLFDQHDHWVKAVFSKSQGVGRSDLCSLSAFGRDRELPHRFSGMRELDQLRAPASPVFISAKRSLTAVSDGPVSVDRPCLRSAKRPFGLRPCRAVSSQEILDFRAYALRDNPKS